MPAKKHDDLPGALKAAILASPLTRYALAKSAGVAQTQIDRFVAGERDLRLETAGKIAKVLGLSLKQEIGE